MKYVYCYTFIIVLLLVSCRSPFLPGTSPLEPPAIPTAHIIIIFIITIIIIIIIIIITTISSSNKVPS
jgi:heme/copper-type cytochrome/quinol oxidase subunit 2